MYRIGLENLLGFRLDGTGFYIDPCIPDTWEGFDLTYLHAEAVYEIRVQNPERVQKGVASIVLDDVTCPDARVSLSTQPAIHRVLVTMGTVPVCAGQANNGD